MASKRSKSSDPLVLGFESEVLTALRQRFGAPEWATITGVGNATGHRANRWADALALSVWPSRGLTIHGFEVKTQRSDLLRELKDPKKADGVGQYCDYWWIAVGSADVVKDGELPKPWGLLVPHRDRKVITMRVVKEATKLKSKALDRAFLFSLLRRVSETYDVERIRKDAETAVRTRAYREIEAILQERHESDLSQARKEAQEAQAKVTAMQHELRLAASAGWDAATIGRAIKLLHSLTGWGGSVAAVQKVLGDLEQDVASIAKIRASLHDARELIHALMPSEKTT